MSWSSPAQGRGHDRMARSRGTGRRNKEQGCPFPEQRNVRFAQTCDWTICFEASQRKETFSGKRESKGWSTNKQPCEEQIQISFYLDLHLEFDLSCVFWLLYQGLSSCCIFPSNEGFIRVSVTKVCLFYLVKSFYKLCRNLISVKCSSLCKTWLKLANRF